MTTIIILCVVGILALLAEIVLPGGIVGITGAICLLIAVGMVFANFGMTAGAIAFALLAISSIIALGYWMKYFHRLPLVKRLILNSSVGGDEELESRQSLVGESGTALTDIHPSGTAKIGDRRIDVMAEGPEIEKGKSLTVVATRGPSILVREA